jgi:hypothetical protein
VSGSVETVEDRAGNVGELVDLLRGEPVEDQAPDLLGVAGDGGAERGAADRGDGGAFMTRFIDVQAHFLTGSYMAQASADGVIVETNTHGVYLGDPRLDPVFAELARRRATICSTQRPRPAGSADQRDGRLRRSVPNWDGQWAYRFGTSSSGIPSALARSGLTFSGTWTLAKWPSPAMTCTVAPGIASAMS